MHPFARAVLAVAAASALCLPGCGKNTPPDRPLVFGPYPVVPKDSLRFRTLAEDPEGDDVAYLFQWGDGTAGGWSAYHPSGETVLFRHLYLSTGIYHVKAKARDRRCLESGWSDSLVVYVGVPEPYWEPSAEDTAAIGAIIRTNKQLFASAFNEFSLLPVDTVLPGTTAALLRDEVRENPLKQRFRCDQMEHLFHSDSYDLEYSLFGRLDSMRAETTCVVTIAETIPGLLRLHAYSYTRYLRDSLLVVSPTETLRLPLYDTLFSDTSMVVEKKLAGASTDGCVLRKTDGQWEFWKVAGGSRFYVGDSLRVPGFLTSPAEVVSYVYLDHVRFEQATGKVPLTEAGVQRLFVEFAPVQTLFEMAGDYVATVWGVSIDVEE
jgi:hypothetical protein